MCDTCDVLLPLLYPGQSWDGVKYKVSSCETTFHRHREAAERLNAKRPALLQPDVLAVDLYHHNEVGQTCSVTIFMLTREQLEDRFPPPLTDQMGIQLEPYFDEA